MNGKTRSFTLVVMAVCFLLAAALACGPVATVVVTATPEPTATAIAGIVPTATPPAPASPTEIPPEPTTAAGCTLGARWVADVTVPDNTSLPPAPPCDERCTDPLSR